MVACCLRLVASRWHHGWTEEVETLRESFHTTGRVEDKTVLYFGRFRGTFHEPFDLRRFPFDRHYLSIRLSTTWPRWDMTVRSVPRLWEAFDRANGCGVAGILPGCCRACGILGCGHGCVDLEVGGAFVPLIFLCL